MECLSCLLVFCWSCAAGDAGRCSLDVSCKACWMLKTSGQDLRELLLPHPPLFSVCLFVHLVFSGCVSAFFLVRPSGCCTCGLHVSRFCRFCLSVCLWPLVASCGLCDLSACRPFILSCLSCLSYLTCFMLSLASCLVFRVFAVIVSRCSTPLPTSSFFLPRSLFMSPLLYMSPRWGPFPHHVLQKTTSIKK